MRRCARRCCAADALLDSHIWRVTRDRSALNHRRSGAARSSLCVAPMRSKFVALRCDMTPTLTPPPIPPAPPLTPLTATRDNPMPIDALGERIAELAARIHAATYELLVMLREYDEGRGWNNGFLSCAHWLNWRTGIDLGAAREKVRVARALPNFPRISGALKCGSISYAKVRAITRVATPETEQRLLDVALAGTASHVERIVRAWRRTDRVIAAKQADARHLSRHLTTWIDDDGMVVLRGRLTPAVGAVVIRALNAATDQLFREAKESPHPGGLVAEVDGR